MNRIYRLVWSHVYKVWIPVAETARGRSKGSSRKLFAAALSLTATVGHTEPIGGQVTSGSGSITQSGATTTINQTSQNMSANWQSFNIAPSETVNFQQPNTSAIAVNRIADTNGTQILGHLNANGQVYLINPNGILFGQGAQVNVGGLVASTLDVNDASLNSNTKTFSGNGAGSVVNKGEIHAADGGSVALLGNTVSNQGVITAQLGTVALGAGSAVTLTFNGNNLVQMQVDQGVLDSLAENKQLIRADGGQVIMTSGAQNALLASVVNNEGVIEAYSVENHNGVIKLGGDMVVNTGRLDVSGNSGGSVDIAGRSLLQAGSIHADGTAGDGGSVNLAAGGTLIQTAAGEITANASGQGGDVKLSGGSSAYLSGAVSANGDRGGQVTATAPQLTLAAANVSADGQTQGGALLIGGDAHGANPAIANAGHTRINGSTTLSAQGRQGKIVAWADGNTDYYGSAKTGPEGFIEISGKQTLNYGGQADAGAGGNLLLDPANLVIDASAPAMFYLDLANPDPVAGEQHGGGGVTTLSNGNIVVATPLDGFGGAKAGAVYLYNGSTGALISTLVGSKANDQVGGNGVTTLSNGNYVVGSYKWNNGTAANAGAVTWGNGASGISGIVSSANSLVGSTAGDQVGFGGITALSNGNYVVNSTYWGNGTAANAGAVTWGSGASGVSGIVSSANSLVGSSAGDKVGYGGITELSNGDYVVRSDYWANGTATAAGAVTWGSGATGVSGIVSSANSLVGSSTDDMVGSSGITVLNNGNYVVSSRTWDNGTVFDAGAVTWGSGTGGISGIVSSANSLVGSSAEDRVGDRSGSNGITALSNGNYVVTSQAWDNGTLVDVGAVTWGSGATGISGIVSSANSLVGSVGRSGMWVGDQVGNGGVTALNNGNYVVVSTLWDNGTLLDAGAVTWGNGAGGTVGAVSSANSLVGSWYNDQVGSDGITALSNGNYVVRSSAWNNNGMATAAGAVTWASGATGISGAVSSANSLVGSTANDKVGSDGITELSNGNYVVSSKSWDNGTVVDAGAVTWASGATGISGAVSSANSLVGSTANDQVGSDGITALSNGNYVVRSSLWDNGAIADAGAVTWGNGAGGASGAVSSANSLVGSTANDKVGSDGVTELSNGNYVVRSSTWSNGTAANAGAVTWGSATGGTSGAVSSANSLVGTKANDKVGSDGVTTLSNGNYVVRSSLWDNGAIADAGAVTWGNGAGGTVGAVSSANSLVGSKASDKVGSDGVTALSNGNYVVRSSSWDNGTVVDAGAVTWGNGDGGTVGAVSSANSLVGGKANDKVGSDGVTALSNGNYLVRSASWDNGTVVDAGAVTWGSGVSGVSGAVSGANSLIGRTANNKMGSDGITTLSNGNYMVRNKLWNNGVGAVWLVADASNLLTMVNNASVSSPTLSPTALAAVVASGSTVTLQASNNITVNSAVNVAGRLNLVAGNAMTLNADITSTATGDALQLAGQSFINKAGANALSTPNGRWLVWSKTPANDTRNGLAYDFKQYNATYGSSTALGSGNGFLYTAAPVVTASLTGNVSKVYDTTPTATLTRANYAASGALDGDTITLNNPTSGIYDSKNAGSGKNVAVTGVSMAGASNGAATVYGYQLAETSINGNVGNISKADLAVTGLTASNKVYDGNTMAVLDGTAAVAPLSGDKVGIDGAGRGVFADANVGTGKAVTVSGFTLKGTDAGNYNVVLPTGLTANITAAPTGSRGATSPTGLTSSTDSTSSNAKAIALARNVVSQLTATMVSSATSNQPGSPSQFSFKKENSGFDSIQTKKRR